MKAVDDVVLDLMRVHLGGEERVHPGQLLPPPIPGGGPIKLAYKLPYYVYTSNVGADSNRRLAGRRVRRSVFFTVKYIGGDQAQTKFAGEKSRGLLERRRIVVPGYDQTWAIECEESQRIFRDDDAVQLNGKPLYYGTDFYAVALMHTNVPAPV